MTLAKNLRLALGFFQRFRANVTPNHFYSEIPDLRELRRDPRWKRPFSMVEIQGADLDAQLAYARHTVEPHRGVLASIRHHTPQHFYQQACDRNGEAGYGPTEAEFLYCYVRTHKPRRVVQVGCGVTTALIQLASSEEPGYAPAITCVEPFPTEFLRREHAAGRIRLVAEPAQWVDLEEFTSLEAGDLLFIDSTHTVRIGGEVPRLFLEVLPRLKAGVRVHVHDIPFPHDYMHRVMHDDVFFNREPVLLMAFLSMNRGYEILTSLSMLSKSRTAELRAILPNYLPMGMDEGVMTGDGHFPSAIYLRRLAG